MLPLLNSMQHAPLITDWQVLFWGAIKDHCLEQALQCYVGVSCSACNSRITGNLYNCALAVAAAVFGLLMQIGTCWEDGCQNLVEATRLEQQVKTFCAGEESVRITAVVMELMLDLFNSTKAQHCNQQQSQKRSEEKGIGGPRDRTGTW